VEKIGLIEIKISGSKGNMELSPDTFDIKEIISILENAENLLYPLDKKDRPTISYKIEEGSVKHIFKTSIQYVIGFNALIAQINQVENIDFLETSTAKAFENIQEIAAKKNYSFSIRTSLADSNVIKIDRTTKFLRKEAVWADAEFYFYGKITNAGGKDKANIHINTDEYGTLYIQTPKSFLEEYNENMLYKNFGIRVFGKQHSETGEIEKGSLKFVELIDYNPKFDENYLNKLINSATTTWSKIKDKDSWLRDLRGGYEA
jgi:hypothetical protein